MMLFKLGIRHVITHSSEAGTLNMPMDDAVNVAFDDEDDAARWIERVCNLFIAQKMTDIFRTMETNLKQGSLDYLLEDNQAYQDELEDKLEDIRLISERKWMQANNIEKKKPSRHKKNGNSEAEEEIKSALSVEQQSMADNYITIQEWQELQLKREHLQFYQYFGDNQFRLQICPFDFDSENSPMYVTISMKNRHTELDRVDPDTFFFLQTEIRKDAFQLSQLESHLHVADMPDLGPEIDDPNTIAMFCLQAVFHASACMLEYYKQSPKYEERYEILKQCDRLFVAVQYNPPDDDAETSLRHAKVRNAFELAAAFSLQDVPSSLCFSNDKGTFFISDYDLNDSMPIQTQESHMLNITTEWRRGLTQTHATDVGVIESAVLYISTIWPNILQNNGTPLIVPYWPLHHEQRASLHAGIMCAYTAKATDELVEIPRIMPWQSQPQKLYQCPGWAWWDVLLQLHAESEYVELTHTVPVIAQGALQDTESQFTDLGVFHLLQALAQFGPYDTMMFGDASMNIMSLFQSCATCNIKDIMMHHLQKLHQCVMLSSNSDVSDFYKQEDMQDVCVQLLNAVCVKFCTKTALPSGTQATWWHTCNTIENEATEKQNEENLNALLNKYKFLFFADKTDATAYDAAMNIATCMWLMHDIVSFSNSSPRQTILTQFITHVYEHYDDVEYKADELLKQDYETELQDAKEHIQSTINSAYLHILRSDIARVLLRFCGCCKETGKNIVDVLYGEENTSSMPHMAQKIHNLFPHPLQNLRDLGGIQSRASVRNMAWKKMAIWRTEEKRKDTIAEQKQGKVIRQAVIRGEDDEYKRKIQLSDALWQNAYVVQMHTMLRQSKARMIENIMYACFVQHCCQLHATNGMHANDMHMQAAMEVWMPVIIGNSRNAVGAEQWHDHIRNDKRHESEPRLEIVIEMLNLAREFYYDCDKYDTMLRCRSAIHSTNRVQNTIARPEEFTKGLPYLNNELE